jgi:hypothetical protein
VDYLIPFSTVFIIGCGIPEVLIELSVCKPRDISVEVCCNLKEDNEAYQISQKNRHVEVSDGCQSIDFSKG